MNLKLRKEVAECVGLWLAEGDKKTLREVTFTNNCLDLILFFKEVLSELYNGKNKPRLYVYSPSERQLFTKLDGFKKINYYIDKRANRPYYIYRLADTKFLKKWRLVANNISSETQYYPDVLRGIFAGEGNVHHSLANNNHRSVRISYKLRDRFIERIFDSLMVKYTFDEAHRNYIISGRYFDVLDSTSFSSLHPEKESKFRMMANSLKETHYSPGELKYLVLSKLDKFCRTKDLANNLNKSDLRILEILKELRDENKIDKIKMNSVWFWVKKDLKDKFLEDEKIKILKQFDDYNDMTNAGKTIGLSRKMILSRLLKYRQEGLINRDGYFWKMTEKGNIICGIDEAGKKV